MGTRTSFIGFDTPNQLICSPPSEVEEMIHASKHGYEVIMTECHYIHRCFLCFGPRERDRHELTVEEAEGYLCLTNETKAIILGQQ